MAEESHGANRHHTAQVKPMLENSNFAETGASRWQKLRRLQRSEMIPENGKCVTEHPYNPLEQMQTFQLLGRLSDAED